MFREEDHTYWAWSGRAGAWLRPSSCSQVLSTAGAKGFSTAAWRASLVRKQQMREQEAAAYCSLHVEARAAIGTELHGLIRQELTGDPAPPVQFAESLLLLAVWRRQFLPQIEAVILCEAPMVSGAGFFSGTPDLVARVSGRWLVLDWKSKASREKAKPDKAWPLQLAGYQILLRDVHGVALEGAANVMVWPDGLEEVFYAASEMAQHRRRYVGCLAWCHAVRASDGCTASAAALWQLLQLQPLALQQSQPPKGAGPWTVAAVLGVDHPAVASCPEPKLINSQQ